jgi:hypothetical protein
MAKAVIALRISQLLVYEIEESVHPGLVALAGLPCCGLARPVAGRSWPLYASVFPRPKAHIVPNLSLVPDLFGSKNLCHSVFTGTSVIRVGSARSAS